jgi:hypothetical protein
MGAQAPTTAAIIRVQLCGRRPAGIANDHLDAADWPLEGAEKMGRTR